jgi:hypothetical protein
VRETVKSSCKFLPGLPSRAGRQAAMAGRLDALDDPDYPAYTTGRAAELLGVRQAFLRALDAAGAVRPQRTAGELVKLCV